jgi:hypothetical protein
VGASGGDIWQSLWVGHQSRPRSRIPEWPELEEWASRYMCVCISNTKKNPDVYLSDKTKSWLIILVKLYTPIESTLEVEIRITYCDWTLQRSTIYMLKGTVAQDYRVLVFSLFQIFLNSVSNWPRYWNSRYVWPFGKLSLSTVSHSYPPHTQQRVESCCF